MKKKIKKTQFFLWMVSINDIDFDSLHIILSNTYNLSDAKLVCKRWKKICPLYKSRVSIDTQNFKKLINSLIKLKAKAVLCELKSNHNGNDFMKFHPVANNNNTVILYAKLNCKVVSTQTSSCQFMLDLNVKDILCKINSFYTCVELYDDELFIEDHVIKLGREINFIQLKIHDLNFSTEIKIKNLSETLLDAIKYNNDIVIKGSLDGRDSIYVDHCDHYNISYNELSRFCPHLLQNTISEVCMDSKMNIRTSMKSPLWIYCKLNNLSLYCIIAPLN